METTHSHARIRLTSEPSGSLRHRRSDVRLAGHIGPNQSMPEIVGMLAFAGWDGTLHIEGDTGTFSLTVAQGALKSAQSTTHEHRLGQLLLQAGLLDEAQLAACLQQVHDGRRLGRVLVEEGWVDSPRLFELLRTQLRTIFFDALAVTRGRFHFTDPELDAEPAPFTGHLPLQTLLLEAAQRSDEMALFRKRVPDAGCRPVLRDAAATPASAETRKVLPHVDGRATIDEIGARTGLDEFQVTRAVHGLLEAGAVSLAPAPHSLRGALEGFGRALGLIMQALDGNAAATDVREQVGAWAEQAGVGALYDALQSDGFRARGVDLERMRRQWGRLDDQELADALHRVLHELVVFALMVAGHALDGPGERDLARRVLGMLAQLPPPRDHQVGSTNGAPGRPKK
ncbi:MAG: DUF4388 domain-containing protein [Myxococcales bacterium]|jgi:hypothetical protein